MYPTLHRSPRPIEPREGDAEAPYRDLHGRRNAICSASRYAPSALAAPAKTRPLPHADRRRRNAICEATTDRAPGGRSRRGAVCEAMGTRAAQSLLDCRLSAPGAAAGVPARCAAFLQRLHLDAFAWTEDGMVACLAWTLCASDLFRSFRLPAPVVGAFLARVRRSYSRYANPFHGFRHAFDVAQFLCVLLGPGRAALPPQHALALFVAALAHDLEHPGTDFALQAALGTPLGRRYGACNSPLERHHFDQLLAILADPECDLFRHLPRGDARALLSLIERCILATDMGQHAAILREWTALKPVAATAAPMSEARAIVLTKLLMKAADISNVCRPWPISVKWSQMLIEEVGIAYDATIGLGCKPTGFQAQCKADPNGVVLQFAARVARPLFAEIVEVLPDARPLLSMLDSNLARWASAIDTSPW